MKLTVAGGLLPEKELNEAVEDFERSTPHTADGEQAVAALCDYLVASNKLTRWQCEKLKEGRYKGFYIDEFLILEHARIDADWAVYLAMDVHAKRQVHLHVRPQSRVGGKPSGPFRRDGDVFYRVTDVFSYGQPCSRIAIADDSPPELDSLAEELGEALGLPQPIKITRCAQSPQSCIWLEIDRSVPSALGPGYMILNQPGGSLVVASDVEQMKQAVAVFTKSIHAEDGPVELSMGLTTNYPIVPAE